MPKKTFKIGEWCRGGIITANVTKTKVILIGKDWDFSAGYNKGSNQSNAKEFTRETFNAKTWETDGGMDWLNQMTSIYYADTIRDWINSKKEVTK